MRITLVLENLPNYNKKLYDIDVPSVCNLKKNTKGKPMLDVFHKVVTYLINLGIPIKNIIGFSDNNFQYHVDDIKGYKNVVNKGLILEMPAAIKADKAILAHCLKHEEAVIISQDLMREYYKYLPSKNWIVKRRICVVIVYDDIYLIPMIDSMKIIENEITSKSTTLPIEEKNDEKYTRTTLDVLIDIEKSEKKAKLNYY